MKQLSTSIYTFSKLIEGGFLYVDKTDHIYELIRPAFGQYFLSRPRRFGKSLLISTLKSIFSGQRELFEGLAINDTDYDWKTYPVIHLDMGSVRATSAQELETNLLRKVIHNAAVYDCNIPEQDCYQAFEDLVLQLWKSQGNVVILVDEYDKPLLGHLGQESAGRIQDVLKGFYSVIKTTEPQQRFVLLTGVSKFSKVSVFSDLNNLTDLTMRRDTATLLGYTQGELEANFSDYIEHLAAAEGQLREETLQRLSDWYNGYRFHPKAETVYNPVSIMKCLQECEFKNYWFETGTPTFLLDLIKRQPVDMNNLTVPETAFSTYEPTRLAALPLLVQTGYLTIKEAVTLGRRREYRLGYPNYEIEESFSTWLAQEFSNLPAPDFTSALHRIIHALNEGSIDDMVEHLKVFFAGIPNNITLKHEKYYQTIFFTVFKLIGAVVEAETSTNIGRIDAVVKTDSDIFIFEFKLHGTAQEALDQIRQKQYAQGYLDDVRRVTLIGAAFDPEERNIGEWVTAPARPG